MPVSALAVRADEGIGGLHDEAGQCAGPNGHGKPSDEQINGQEALEAFDPGEHNALDVHAYIAENPADVARVLEAERASKQQSGISTSTPPETL